MSRRRDKMSSVEKAALTVPELHAEIAALRATLDGSVTGKQLKELERKAQEIGFAFGVAAGMKQTLEGVRRGITGLNLGDMIRDSIKEMDAPAKAAPDPKSVKRSRKP
jgi:polysaccharide deacetylase 2 family uncharacterized protein YibQ